MRIWIWFVVAFVVIMWATTLGLLYWDDTEKLGDIGKFGDMFGAVNALFSGLAFAGMIYAIWLQSQELRRTNEEMGGQSEMLELQKNELTKTNEQMELQNESLRLQNQELIETRKEFKMQNETLSLQRFENTFFQLLNLYHEIIDKVDCTGFFNHDGDKGKKQREGLYFAASVLNECLDKAVTKFRSKSKISKTQAWDLLNKGYQDFYFVRQYELVLSHYFRNLYHILKYVYLSNDLEPNQKKFYATLVRAQLSPDEQYLIYYNCMIKGVGNPKSLFLVKHFDLMQNFNNWEVRQFSHHEELFQDLKNDVSDPFNGNPQIPAIPTLP